MTCYGALRAPAPYALLLLAALGLSACGSDQGTAAESAGSSSPSSSSSSSSASSEPSDEPTAEESATVPPGSPDCSTIWRDGAKLPRTYKGCAEGAVYVERDVLGCSSGQRMVRYANRYYGVLGGTVHKASAPLDEDDDYRAATHRCRA